MKRMGWINYKHYNEDKRGLNKIDLLPETIKSTINELNSPAFLEWLSALTGIRDLQKDEDLEGGGNPSIHPRRLPEHPCRLHRPSPPPQLAAAGERTGLSERRLEGGLGWQAGAMGPQNESLRSKRFTRLQSLCYFQYRCRLLSWPSPAMTCPEGTFRRSIALYYYTVEENPYRRATYYQARPGDGSNKLLVKTRQCPVVCLYGSQG